MSHDNTVTYKKLASRWDRRTLPSEPRHLCFVYIIGIVVILSTIVIVSTGVGCTNFVCPHRGLANGTLRFSRKHVFLNTVPLCCRPSTYGTPENAVPCKMVGKRRITGSRSFKVIRIGTNRKPRCDFLLLTNGHISHCFRDSATKFLTKTSEIAIFTLCTPSRWCAVVWAIGRLGVFAIYRNCGRIFSRLWDIQRQRMAW